MAYARFAKGLRKGSTKSETYSTLPTAKHGRVQIVKDRVYDIANPQTSSQMMQRTIFATVNKAASVMSQLVSISFEGQTRAQFSKQKFVTENVKFLKSVNFRRVGLNRHYLAAYAPKGAQYIVPNSYIVSKGSLDVPAVLIPQTDDNKGSFGAATYKNVAEIGGIPFGNVTPADLWRIMFGVQPGDQLTFPQILGDDTAQVMYEGDETTDIIDKTLVCSFAAPRIVLLKSMPATSLTISASTTLADLKAALRSGINTEASWEAIVDNLINNITLDDTADDTYSCNIDVPYDEVFGVSNDDSVRAIGCILSRQDENGKWQYSTTQLMCVWDHLGQNSGADYFGFTLENAASTYLKNVSANDNGNFLQRGGTADILPSSFA